MDAIPTGRPRAKSIVDRRECHTRPHGARASIGACVNDIAPARPSIRQVAPCLHLFQSEDIFSGYASRLNGMLKRQAEIVEHCPQAIT